LFRLFVDQARFRDFLFAAGAKFFEFSTGHEEAAFDLVHGAVVGADRLVEALAEGVEVIGHGGNAFVEFDAELADFLGVFREGFLFPTIGCGLEERDERGRRGEDDANAGAAFEKIGFVAERGAVESFAGDEENDELGRRLDVFPVGFVAEGIDVAADNTGVLLELGDAICFVTGFKRFEVGLHGSLGVDRDGFAAGELDDHVGADLALGFLLDEIDVLNHAGEFDHALELDFAPATGGAGGTE